VINLDTGFGRILYFAWLSLTIMLSSVCNLGFAMSSIGMAFIFLLVCTLPLISGFVGAALRIKWHPVAVIIGSGSVLAYILFVSLRDISATGSFAKGLIANEGWWQMYFCIYLVQLILAVLLLRQLGRISNELVTDKAKESPATL
jgi:hypothetical protein